MCSWIPALWNWQTRTLLTWGCLDGTICSWAEPPWACCYGLICSCSTWVPWLYGWFCEWPAIKKDVAIIITFTFHALRYYFFPSKDTPWFSAETMIWRPSISSNDQPHLVQQPLFIPLWEQMSFFNHSTLITQRGPWTDCEMRWTCHNTTFSCQKQLTFYGKSLTFGIIEFYCLVKLVTQQTSNNLVKVLSLQLSQDLLTSSHENEFPCSSGGVIIFHDKKEPFTRAKNHITFNGGNSFDDQSNFAVNSFGTKCFKK